jgi:hypothetical protein
MASYYLVHSDFFSLCGSSIFVSVSKVLAVIIIKVEITDLINSWSAFTILFASRLIRFVPFMVSHPSHLWLTPFIFIYLYGHTFLKLYALFTLTNVGLVDPTLIRRSIPLTIYRLSGYKVTNEEGS